VSEDDMISAITERSSQPRLRITQIITLALIISLISGGVTWSWLRAGRAEAHAERVQHDLNETNAKAASLLDGERIRLGDALRDRDATQQALDETKAKLIGTQTDLAAVQRHVISLQTDLASTKAKLTEAESLAANRQTEISQLKDRVTAAETKVTTAEAKVANQETELTEVKRKLTDVSTERDQAKTNHTKAEALGACPNNAVLV
jgi:chromosome segregation ATPase